MKALMKTQRGIGNVKLVEYANPICDDNNYLIEVKYCGICGTDIHVYNDTFNYNPPVILGHEISGIIIEKGKNVSSYEIGDSVSILGSIKIICGKCEYCKTGMYMFCPYRKGMGHGTHGGFTKYILAREDMLFKLPENISLEEGALLEPFACAVQTVEEITTLKISDSVLISGPGPIGLLCLSLALNHGCKVYVTGTDLDNDRLEVARKMGAYKVINITKEDLSNTINDESNGKGFDIVIECSGSPTAISNAIRLTKKLGTYIQVGISGKDINLGFDQIIYKQLKIYGSLGHSITSWYKAIKILSQQRLNIKPIITHILPLSEWEEGFQLVEKKKGIKVLLYPD